MIRALVFAAWMITSSSIAPDLEAGTRGDTIRVHAARMPVWKPTIRLPGPLPDSVYEALQNATGVQAFLMNGCGPPPGGQPLIGPLHNRFDAVAVRPGRKLPPILAARLTRLLLDASRYTGIQHKCGFCADVAYDVYSPRDTVSVFVSRCLDVGMQGRSESGGAQFSNDALELADIVTRAFPEDTLAMKIRRDAVESQEARAHLAETPRPAYPPDDLGFRYLAMRGDSVQIVHDDKVAATLRGAKASQFLARVTALEFGAAQQLMARLTGNYKRGNERSAKDHSRNRP